MSEGQNYFQIQGIRQNAIQEATSVSSGNLAKANQLKSAIGNGITGVGSAITVKGLSQGGRLIKHHVSNYLKKNGATDEEADDIADKVSNGDLEGAGKSIFKSGMNKLSQGYQNVKDAFNDGFNKVLNKVGLRSNLARGQAQNDDDSGIDKEPEGDELGRDAPAPENDAGAGGDDAGAGGEDQAQAPTQETQAQSDANAAKVTKEEDDKGGDDDDDDEDEEEGAEGDEGLDGALADSTVLDETPVGAVITGVLGVATILGSIFGVKASDNPTPVVPQQIPFQSGVGN